MEGSRTIGYSSAVVRETKTRVSPGVYDRDYLLSDNTEGFQEFQAGSVSFVKALQLEQLELVPGLRLLEVGFGRGEFLRLCAEHGAQIAAIDYSADALSIGRETLAAFPEADLRIAECTDLPFPAESFDRVYSGDVIEHVDREDGVCMLKEMCRVLRPGGLMFLHTAPNTVFTRGVLPLVKPILRMIDPETVQALEEHMKINEPIHVNEYNLFTLRKVVRLAGLDGAAVWIGADVLRSSRHRHTLRLANNPLVRISSALGRFSPVRFFLGNDLFVKWRKPVA